jgi:hypothetical protein
MHDGLREVIRQIDSIYIASSSLRAEYFLISTHRVRTKLVDFHLDEKWRQREIKKIFQQ